MTSLRRVTHAAIAILCLFVFLFGTEASAATYNWVPNNTSGSWTDAANWGVSSGYPGTNDDVTISATAGLINITIPQNITIASLSVSGDVTLTTNFTLTVTGATQVGVGALKLSYDQSPPSTPVTMLALNSLSLMGMLQPAVSPQSPQIIVTLNGMVTMDNQSSPLLGSAYIANGIHSIITHQSTLFGSHVRFDGNLEFEQTSNGLYRLGNYNLYLGKAADLITYATDGAGYIATTSDNNASHSLVGRLCKEYSQGYLDAFEFPVGAAGNSDKYVPISVKINSYTPTNFTWNYNQPFPYVSVRVVAEKHPANQQAPGSFNLYWVVEGVGTPDTELGGEVCLDVQMRYHNNYRTGSPAPLYSARFTPSYESMDEGIWDLTGSKVSSTGGNVRDVPMGAPSVYPNTACGVPGFGDFSIAVEGSALPVELTSFSARYVRNTVELKWLTATELNNYGFAIERSLDGRSWKEVDFVPGAGNSFSPRSYSWTDKLDDDLLRSGKLAYRLLQMDRDGSTEYSNIVYVNLGPAPTAVQLHEAYPNPFNPATTVSFTLPAAGPASVIVHNVFGQEVVTLLDNASLDAGVHTVSFNGDRLPSGSYIVVLKAGGVVRHQRIVLSK